MFKKIFGTTSPSPSSTTTPSETEARAASAPGFSFRFNKELAAPSTTSKVPDFLNRATTEKEATPSPTFKLQTNTTTPEESSALSKLFSSSKATKPSFLEKLPETQASASPAPVTEVTPTTATGSTNDSVIKTPPKTQSASPSTDRASEDVSVTPAAQVQLQSPPPPTPSSSVLPQQGPTNSSIAISSPVTPFKLPLKASILSPPVLGPMTPSPNPSKNTEPSKGKRPREEDSEQSEESIRRDLTNLTFNLDDASDRVSSTPKKQRISLVGPFSSPGAHISTPSPTTTGTPVARRLSLPPPSPKTASPQQQHSPLTKKPVSSPSSSTAGATTVVSSLSEKYLKESKDMDKIESKVKEMKRKDYEMTESMERISEEMKMFEEDLRQLAVKIYLQNNKVLMMNNPALNDKIEEIQAKYSYLLEDMEIA